MKAGSVGTYNPGKGSDVVVVQAFVKFPLVVLSKLGVQYATDNTGTKLLTSSVVHKNEPFTWEFASAGSSNSK